MFNGDKINVTENRSVLHTALRNFQTRKFNNLDSINTKLQVSSNLFLIFVTILEVEKKNARDYFTDVVNIGIGGSELGPKLVTSALSEYHDGPKIHFVSNIDSDINKIIKKLDSRKLFLSCLLSRLQP